jgi:hypothetical protein
MKKLFKSFVLILMSIVMVFGVVACDTSNTIGGVKMEDPKGTITPSLSPWEEELDTTHEINVTPGTKDFVVNGQTEYKLVIPDAPANKETTYGASEISQFMLLSSGAIIEVVSDKDLSYDAESKYISVGDTNLIEKAGITVDRKALTRSGYTIISKGNSVFIIGGGDFGTLWGCYEFLKHEINWETYTQNETVYDINSNVKLHEYDIVDIPDFTYRISTQGWSLNDSTTRQRMRHNNWSGANAKIWMGPDNVPWHNTFHFLPPAKWQASHPKWYSTDGQQLCFNAHGDEQEAELMFKEFMRSFINVVNANPDIDNITITQMDVNVWCRCDTCTQKFNHYKTDGADIVQFCNKVSVALEEYFTENNIDRQVNICFFAYHKTTDAPVVKNETTGEWEPIDSSVICRDNVYCFYAPIRADYIRDFYDPANIAYKETMDKWCVLSPHMYLWVYSTRFPDYFDPYNCLNQMQENYILAKAHDVSYIFDQQQHNNSYATDWAFLKGYLQSKLQWDVKANKAQLIENFMNNVYKDAAEPMKKALNLYNSWFEYLKTERNLPGPYSNDITKTEYWPKGVIDTMNGYFEEAYKAIEHYKNSDPALYSKLYDRICIETLVYRLMDIRLYATAYSDDEMYRLKYSFKEDCMRIGISHYNEGGPIAGMWEGWL